ncbi:MAG: glycosyltransferase family 39 protein [Oligoflexia bacterium]|nr:glycosyltransferase family 39 protein [Oligoflexia bacterium]
MSFIKERFNSFNNLVLKDNTVVISILIVAFSIRVINLLINNYTLVGDEISYYEGAINLAQGNGYISADGKYIDYFPILYSLFLSSFYYLFTPSILMAKIINIFLGVITCWLTFLFAEKLTTKKIAVFCLIAMAINPQFVKISGKLLSENLFLPIFLLWIIIALNIHSNLDKTISLRKKIYYSIIHGIVFGIMLLSKVIAAGLLPAFIFSYLLSKNYHLKEKILLIIVGAISILAIITPWIVRNYSVYDRFVPLTTTGGITFYSSNVRKGQPYGNMLEDDLTLSLKKENPVDRSAYLTQYTLKYLKENLSTVPYLLLQKTGYFWGPLDWEVMSEDGYSKFPGYNFVYISLLPFFVIGVFRFLKSFNYNSFFLFQIIMLLQIFSVYGTCLIHYGSARQRMVIEPLIMVFSLISLANYKKWFGSAILCYFTLNFIIFIYIIPIKVFLKNTSWLKFINFY